MRKIAILKGHGGYDCYDNFEIIINKITDFEEIDDETFHILKQAEHEFGFTVIEMPENTGEFVATTVAQYKELVEKRRLAQEKAKRIEEKRKLESLLKKKAAKEAKEKKLLEELIRTHGIPQ